MESFVLTHLEQGINYKYITYMYIFQVKLLLVANKEFIIKDVTTYIGDTLQLIDV